MVTSFAFGGGLALSLVFPRGQAAAASLSAQITGTPWEALAGKEDIEINPWLVIAPDDTVTIRVAQSEMGQATFTSWAKMIVEELECDWSKVRAEYASVNRHVRENKVYQRMATNSSSSVRVSRQYSDRFPPCGSTHIPAQIHLQVFNSNSTHSILQEVS